MKTTRREFLGSTAAVVVGAAGVSAALVKEGRSLIGDGGAAPAGNPRERKDVSKLDATSADIVALKAGVDAMKKLPAADLRNWKKQAEIHGKILGDDYNHCQHSNWWFLPWHRAYLYYFEEIVRELS